jgi:hypothetical protein
MNSEHQAEYEISMGVSLKSLLKVLKIDIFLFPLGFKPTRITGFP